ncbi:MAG TPA: RNA methyltransferase [Ktedonobacteraceae bacterium]|nr:RNA methyltransferase [Ktedonobacteraceae bacterium]
MHASISPQRLSHIFIIMTLITSPGNPRISKLRNLHTRRARRESGIFLMEGPHLLDALLDAEVLPLEVYYQPDLLQRTTQGSNLLARLLETLEPEACIEVSERVIEALGEVQTSQGVVSVLPLDAFDPERLRTQRMRVSRPVLLILDAVSDPGNMGTILRTALAADVASVLLTSGCVDCYNPKVVRAAAGAHIALPIESNLPWSAIEEKVTYHCRGNPRLLLADAGSPNFYYEQDLTQPFALIIGNEAKGPSREARQRATLTISIPLANHVESLNAAMATGIMLYEAVRQKRTSGTR